MFCCGLNVNWMNELSDICDVGRLAKNEAELCNRANVNLMDFASALAEFNQPIDTLIDFKEQSDSLPFIQRHILQTDHSFYTLPHYHSHALSVFSLTWQPSCISFETVYSALPRFPLPKPVYLIEPSAIFASDEPEGPLPPHIPPYLPAFPPSHTYHHTPSPLYQPLSSDSLRQKKLEATRAIERSLVKLHRIAEQRKDALAIEERKENSNDTTNSSSSSSSSVNMLNNHVNDSVGGGSHVTSTVPAPPLVRTASSQLRERELASNPFFQPPTIAPAPIPAPPLSDLLNTSTPFPSVSLAPVPPNPASASSSALSASSATDSLLGDLNETSEYLVKKEGNGNGSNELLFPASEGGIGTGMGIAMDATLDIM